MSSRAGGQELTEAQQRLLGTGRFDRRWQSRQASIRGRGQPTSALTNQHFESIMDAREQTERSLKPKDERLRVAVEYERRLQQDRDKFTRRRALRLAREAALRWRAGPAAPR